MVSEDTQRRRKFGQHFTTMDIFNEFILPHLKPFLYDYLWVDLYAGEGNLILPILKEIPEENRIEFFQNHIFLFDVQPEWVAKSIENAMSYGIPQKIAVQNITQHDSLAHFPSTLQTLSLPIFHVTNPPYLYLGYIVKTVETQNYLPLFQGNNKGLQDLYQVALMNDLRNKVQKMVYIIPSNFIFGNSVSNKIRNDFFPYYTIEHSVIFEKQIFEHTGTNVMINFFVRKEYDEITPIVFPAQKIGLQNVTTNYNLKPIYHYKAGNEFEEFITHYKSPHPLKFTYYLKQEDVDTHPGNNKLQVIDANLFQGSDYHIMKIAVDSHLNQKILANSIWIRTVDTGSLDGRAGLYNIHQSFHVDGILVTKNTYRTHPIQIFFNPPLTSENQTNLILYFNKILEFLRHQTDSEFMTTYKYSNGSYTRKYFGLSQAKKIIETFPVNDLTLTEYEDFVRILKNELVEAILPFLSRKFF